MSDDTFLLEQQINKLKRKGKASNVALIETNSVQKAWTPNNFMKSKGVCIEDTLYPSEWLLSEGNGVTNVRRVTDAKLFESGCIEFDIVPVQYKSITKSISYDFTNVNYVAFAIFIEDQYSFDSVEIRISSHPASIYNNWTHYFKNTAGINTSSGKLHAGWNYIKLHKSEFTNIGTEVWATLTSIRFILGMPTSKFTNGFSTLTGEAIVSTTIGIGGIYLNPVYDTPKLLINFDDSSSSMFANGFPYMRKKGVKATVFLCKNHMGGVSYMTEQQHQEWYDAGNDIGTHSVTHQDMWVLNEQQLIAEFAPPIQYVLSKGWTRGAYILAFPMGRYNKIALKVVKDLGVKFARGRNVGLIDHVTPDDMLEIPTCEIKGTTLLSDITGYIDQAILRQSSVSIFTHNIVASNPDVYSTLITTFQSYIDYAVAKRDAGLIEIVTYSEFYNKLSDKTINIPNIITS